MISTHTRIARSCTYETIGAHTYDVLFWERGRSQVIGTVQKQGNKWTARTPLDTLVTVAGTRTAATVALAKPYYEGRESRR